jgi:hypothetical protein
MEKLPNTKKEESIKELTKAVKANSILLLKAVREMDIDHIKTLLKQLRRLERNIYRRLKRDKNIDSVTKSMLKKQLSELQAIYHKDKEELKVGHVSSLRVLAGEEEIISEEMIREIEKTQKTGMIVPPKEIKKKYKHIWDLFEPGDMIAISMAWRNSKFGRASKVFELVTGSKVSHIGIVHVKRTWYGARKVFVIEASDNVVVTPIENFIADGNGRIAVYRYKKGLTPEQQKVIINSSLSWAKKMVSYDKKLSPGIEELYCSELVDEAYKAAGIKLTNNYISVRDFYDRVKNLYDKGGWKLFGRSFNSAQEAAGKVLGSGGYYLKESGLDFNKVNKLPKVKSIISPAAIIFNSKTKKVFNNLT